jgi:glucosamine 6-phosphate synthetase-like amidotransferase/phosphosugar isomerase protein
MNTFLADILPQPAALPVQLLAYQSAANLGLQAGVMRYLDWVVK